MSEARSQNTGHSGLRFISNITQVQGSGFKFIRCQYLDYPLLLIIYIASPLPITTVNQEFTGSQFIKSLKRKYAIHKTVVNMYLVLLKNYLFLPDQTD
jgi:hypothetical protein